MTNSTAFWILFLLCSSLGSFYGNCAIRMNQLINESLLKKNSKTQESLHRKYYRLLILPSHCLTCKHLLAFYEKIPIFSFILLLGRCKICHKRIPFTSWLCEVYPILLLTLFYHSNLPVFDFFFYSLGFTVYSGHLFIHIATDFRYYYLSFYNSLILLFVAGLYSFYPILSPYPLSSSPVIFSSATGERWFFALFILIVFLFLFWISTKKKALGLGDVILAPIIFLQLPVYHALLTLQLGAALAIGYILYPILLEQIKNTKQKRIASPVTLRNISRIPAPLGGCLCLANLAINLFHAFQAIPPGSLF